MAKYKIVNGFKDIHTGTKYSRYSEPVEFSDKRVEEIRTVEKSLNYKLIDEVKPTNNEHDKSKSTDKGKPNKEKNK